MDNSKMAVSVGIYLSLVVHIWIVALVWHFFDPPVWLGFPALVSCGISFIAIGSYISFKIQQYEERMGSDAANSPINKEK